MIPPVIPTHRRSDLSLQSVDGKLHRTKNLLQLSVRFCEGALWYFSEQSICNINQLLKRSMTHKRIREPADLKTESDGRQKTMWETRRCGVWREAKWSSVPPVPYKQFLANLHSHMCMCMRAHRVHAHISTSQLTQPPHSPPPLPTTIDPVPGNPNDDDDPLFGPT